ncbi:MAG: hemerythrin domain-containing protein [Rhizobiaceae bacterium]
MTIGNGEQGGNSGKEIINLLLDYHQTQLDLCDRLERLADSLPGQINKQECLSISWQIYPMIKAAHRFEEEKLFPMLTADDRKTTAVARSLERLKFEHWEDESSAEDISISLRQMISEPAATNFEKVAYMLRGFFEGLRRHIAFEQDHLLPLINNSSSLS